MGRVRNAARKIRQIVEAMSSPRATRVSNLLVACLERLHQESHQAIDVLGMFAPVTKWNACIISNGLASMGIAVPVA